MGPGGAHANEVPLLNASLPIRLVEEALANMAERTMEGAGDGGGIPEGSYRDGSADGGADGDGDGAVAEVAEAWRGLSTLLVSDFGL